MKKYILTVLVIINLKLASQNIFDPKIYSLNDGKQTERKIIKVSNDSIYMFYPNVVHFAKATLSLCNLKTGKLLREITINNELLASVNSSDFLNFAIQLENDKIVIFVTEEINKQIVLFKHILNPDLTITKSPKAFKLDFPKTIGLVRFDVIVKDDYYVAAFFDHEHYKAERNTNTSFFCVATLDKNLNLLDSFSYTYHKSRKTAFKKPDQYNSYNLLYQLNFGGNDECVAEKMIINPDKKGKLMRFKSTQLTNYDHFIFEKDSLGTTYGYCLNYLNPDSKNVDIAIVKFSLDFKTQKFHVINSKMAKKSLLSRSLKSIQIQNYINGSKLHLLINVLNLSEGGNMLGWFSNSASYYIFENDTLQTTHYLSLNAYATNPDQAYATINLVPLKKSVFMCYNDHAENEDYNTSALSEVGPELIRLDVFGKPRPALFSVLEGGHLQKNYSFNKDELTSYMVPHGIYADNEDNIYIPYSFGKKTETKIIKIEPLKEEE